MQRTLALETIKKIGKKVRLLGWVSNKREHGKITFVDLRDTSGIVQIVGGKELAKLGREYVVEVIGKTCKRGRKMINPNIPTGKIEIKAEKVNVLSTAEQELPIPITEKVGKESSLSKRLDWRWLDLREPKKLLIFKVWTVLEQAFREYWLSKGFLQIHSPKIMAAPSESGSELFEVRYFNRKAYLAQSPQFYKQMAMAAGFEKVFEIGPVFRANPSFTSRHDTEFTSYDIEMSFIESHEDVMQAEEKMLVYILTKIKEKYAEEIERLYQKKLVVPKIPFPRITFREAKEILAKLNVPSKEGDLSPEEERKLSEFVKKEKGHEFLFVTEWPIEARPFYHMRLEKNSQLTKSFDLYWKGLEITTGAQREHRYKILIRQAREKGLKLRPIQFYLNFFKWGCPPHGGFGFGPTRTLMKIFSLRNVREATFAYRGPRRLVP